MWCRTVRMCDGRRSKPTQTNLHMSLPVNPRLCHLVRLHRDDVNALGDGDDFIIHATVVPEAHAG